MDHLVGLFDQKPYDTASRTTALPPEVYLVDLYNYLTLLLLGVNVATALVILIGVM